MAPSPYKVICNVAKFSPENSLIVSPIAIPACGGHPESKAYTKKKTFIRFNFKYVQGVPKTFFKVIFPENLSTRAEKGCQLETFNKNGVVELNFSFFPKYTHKKDILYSFITSLMAQKWLLESNLPHR